MHFRPVMTFSYFRIVILPNHNAISKEELKLYFIEQLDNIECYINLA